MNVDIVEYLVLTKKEKVDKVSLYKDLSKQSQSRHRYCCCIYTHEKITTTFVYYFMHSVLLIVAFNRWRKKQQYVINFQL